MSSSCRTYMTEFKLQAVEMLTQQGLSPSEVAGRSPGDASQASCRQ
jgi:transposase-like protein